MLVVTTTVGMVHWVHSHTSNLRESLSKPFVFEEKGACLHDGLLVSTSTSNDANSCSTVAWNSLSGS